MQPSPVTTASAPAEPLHVLLVAGSLQLGGGERVISEIANYWAARGRQVTFATLVSEGSGDFYSLHPAIARVGLDGPANGGAVAPSVLVHARRVMRLRKLIRNKKPDTVLSFIDRANIITLLAALGADTRVVVAERTHPGFYFGLSRSWKFLRKMLYRRAACVVAQTEAAGRWLAANCRANTAVIANPLRELPARTESRDPTILSIGRLDRWKGFDLLLKAFARISTDVPDWSVVIIGAGPEADALRAQRDALGLSERVTFQSPVQDIETWYARAGIVVQASRLEGFPNVLLEALGMGAPVIATDCPAGPSEIIDDGVNGRLVPVDDEAALARAMRELIFDPAGRERLARRAVDVREKYSQDRLMKEWEACVFNWAGGCR